MQSACIFCIGICQTDSQLGKIIKRGGHVNTQTNYIFLYLISALSLGLVSSTSYAAKLEAAGSNSESKGASTPVNSKTRQQTKNTKLRSSKMSKAKVSQVRSRLDYYKVQRKDFLAAERAFKKKKIGEYKRLLANLRDYPLYPHLVHTDYSKRLKKLSNKQIENFIKKYGEVPIVRQLRFKWLAILAKKNMWRKFKNNYVTTTNTKFRCLYKAALYRTGQKKKALENMSSLWLTHKSLPKQCNFIINKWRRKGGLSRKLVWDRIELTFRKRAYRRARSLAKYLPKKERHWLTTWYQVYRKPQRLTQKKLLRSKNPIALKIITTGMIRMSRSKPDQAGKLWSSKISRKAFSPKQTAAIKRSIGLVYSYRRDAKANVWLSQIPNELADKQVKLWRVRSALAQENWQQVLTWINKLSAADQAETRWQYWRARALEASGQKRKAKRVYQKAAKSRSFEGFLAADRLKIPYTFENKSLFYPEDQLLRIESIIGITRARELYFLGRIKQARREWYYSIKNFSEKELKMAAVIAHRWGWYSHVISTLGKSTFRDDLTLRFPIAHKSTVIRQSTKTQVNPAWAMAVIRRESAFAPDARSHAGARGLMQLMPRTARFVARKMKTRVHRTSHLYRPNLNIRLGMNYLRMKLNTFKEHKVLATAAYNAGGHRVKKWLPKNKPKSADIWIETIPFTETRDYCRNVMAYMTIYEQRMGLTPQKISDRLPPIHTRSSQ